MLYFRQLSIECLFLDAVCPLSHKGCADKFYAVYNRKTFNSMQIMPLIFSSWAVISAHATAIPLSCGVYNNCLFTKRDIYFILYLIGHSENPRQEIWYQMNAFYVSLDLSEQILLGFFLVFLLELLKLCQSSKTFKCQFPILSLVFFLSLFFVTAQKAFFIQSFFVIVNL